MSILNLTLYPDDPLTRVAEPVTEFGPELARLAKDMLETMYAHEGVGLAGPQVGLARRLFVLHEPDMEPLCLVNPEISELEGREEGEEGCLSLPRIYAPVPRATRLRVQAFDPYGKALDFEARDFLARIIQHELDHLNGVVFLDRLDILTRQAKLQEWEEVRAKLMTPLTGAKRA
jgi:peptide deformylase